MDFRSLLQSMTSLSEATKETGKGRIHTAEPGGYGRKDDEDADGNPVKSASTEKRGRGRPKKDSDSSGETKSYDTKSLGNVFGGGNAPKKAVGTVSKKHSLKEYMEASEQLQKFEAIMEGMFGGGVDHNLTAEQLAKLARVIKSVQTPEQFAVAQKYAKRMAGTIMNRQHDDMGFGSGMKSNMGVSRDIQSDLKAKAHELGIDYKALEEEELTIKPMPGASQIVGADGETLGTADAATANTLKQAAAKGTLNLGQPMKEGKDQGKPGKNFAKIAKSAAKEYGSKAAGERVAGAVKAKLAKQGKLEEATKEKEPEGTYSKKRFETDSQRIARIAKEKRQAEKKKSEEKVDESAKPDFLDMDKDGDKKESFKKAVKDKEDKKKVKESISFTEMSHDTQSEAQEMLSELQDDIDNFITTGHCSDKLEAFLKVHGHSKKKMTDEGSIETHTQHGLDAKPSKFVAVDPKQAPTPWKVDPIQAATDRAGSFIKSLAAPKKTFEGTDMKDMQVESWEKQLNGLLTEGITVSSSQGQQGAPDSVTVSATDADSQQLLQVLRQAGIGAFGGEQPSSNYGAPMAPHGQSPEGHGTEPESAPEVAGDGDDMIALIKKMTGIQDSGMPSQEQPGTLEPAQGGEEGGQDYEDEEGSEEEHGSDGHEEDEEEVEEGNAFSGAVTKAKEDGVQPGEKINVGGKEYPVKEEDEQHGHDHEEGETCNECGMYECECPHEEEKVEEGYANEPDIEMMKLKALLSMGGDMHRQKQSQATGNIQKVTMETKLMQQSTNLISDWKKLSGIK